MKANMAAAGVLLSLLPTILSLAGSSSAEIGLLGQRRPFLACLIAAGSPAVSPFWIFEAREPGDLLHRRSDAAGLLARQDLGTLAKFALLALQYILAAAAVANVIHTSWQLGVQTLCSFSTETTFHPLLWASAALIAHSLGAMAVKLRVTVTEDSLDSPLPVLWTIRKRVKDEFQLSAHQPQAYLVRKQESYVHSFVSWCASTGTILHLIYGTVTFSSILFISTRDALGVVGRYLMSTIVCRVLLNFEIGGMRAAVHGAGDLDTHEHRGSRRPAISESNNHDSGVRRRSAVLDRPKLYLSDFSESPTVVFDSPDGANAETPHQSEKDIPRSWSNSDTA